MKRVRSIGILYLCTGRYWQFWKDFYRSAESNFLPGVPKTYLVFTDSPKIRGSILKRNVRTFHQPALDWPFSTLNRYAIFLAQRETLLNFEYLAFFNSNYLFNRTISAEEFFPAAPHSLIAAIHPGHFDCDQRKYPYCRNPDSAAYMPNDTGRYYVCGGINGGETAAFLAAMQQLQGRIKHDSDRGIVADWHDESHWNKLIDERLSRTTPDVHLLSPAFVVPEECGVLPFERKLILRNKRDPRWGGHEYLRGVVQSPSTPAEPPPPPQSESRRTYFRFGKRSRPERRLLAVDFSGGLGNQLFQYAFSLALQERFPEARVVINCDEYSNPAQRRRFELMQVFPHAHCEMMTNEELRSFRPNSFAFPSLMYAEHAFQTHGNVRYSGYWQSQRFFPRESTLRSSLRFAPQMAQQNSALVSEISSTNSVALHIRRTDYINGFNAKHYNVCSDRYYERAVATVRENVNAPRFYVFSDEPSWAAARFAGPGFYVVQNHFPVQKDGAAPSGAFETDPSQHSDLFLMSQCKHHIIANSSYSWWGAWLNSNAEKLVVAPNTWLHPGLVQAELGDILPPSWIRIPVAEQRESAATAVG